MRTPRGWGAAGCTAPRREAGPSQGGGDARASRPPAPGTIGLLGCSFPGPFAAPWCTPRKPRTCCSRPPRGAVTRPMLPVLSLPQEAPGFVSTEDGFGRQRLDGRGSASRPHAPSPCPFPASASPRAARVADRTRPGAAQGCPVRAEDRAWPLHSGACCPLPGPAGVGGSSGLGPSVNQALLPRAWWTPPGRQGRVSLLGDPLQGCGWDEASSSWTSRQGAASPLGLCLPEADPVLEGGAPRPRPGA